MLTGLATTLISKCMCMNSKTSNYISIKLFLRTIKTSHWFRLQGPRSFFVNSWFTSLFTAPMSVGTLSSLPACAFPEQKKEDRQRWSREQRLLSQNPLLGKHYMALLFLLNIKFLSTDQPQGKL